MRQADDGLSPDTRFGQQLLDQSWNQTVLNDRMWEIDELVACHCAAPRDDLADKANKFIIEELCWWSPALFTS